MRKIFIILNKGLQISSKKINTETYHANFSQLVGKKLIEKTTLEEFSRFLQNRCAKLGYVPSLFQKLVSTEAIPRIKLFGDHTFFNDTAIWRELKPETELSDLELDREEILLLIFKISRKIEFTENSFEIYSYKEKIENFKKVEDVIIFLSDNLK